jgi:hypothetical protein
VGRLLYSRWTIVVLVIVYLYAVLVVLLFGLLVGNRRVKPPPGRGVLKYQVAGSVIKSGG